MSHDLRSPTDDCLIVLAYVVEWSGFAVGNDLPLVASRGIAYTDPVEVHIRVFQHFVAARIPSRIALYIKSLMKMYEVRL